MVTLLLILFFVFAILLILSVLVQSQREGHLDMFGGGGNPFGVQSSSIFNRITTIIGIIFFIVVFLLSFSYNRMGKLQREKLKKIEAQEKAQENNSIIKANPNIEQKKENSNEGNTEQNNEQKNP
ncbi:MAG: preprotein translocase subunit SecG [Spirochaetes bacterium]|nr:preprotein translocase subunit SecG [Spirochaetota bacterium]